MFKDPDYTMQTELTALRQQLHGQLFFDDSTRGRTQVMAYSTDASVYQQHPLAVVIPEDAEDIRLLIDFARRHKVTLIPRAAGTSLAGQVVGDGIVVDISTHFTRILELNEAEKWVRVQPGVIRDDLNVYLKPFNLMFGPETSTANRAMIGGMTGNNSCGLHSIVWGSVRDHLLEVKGFLADGTEVTFGREDDLTDPGNSLKATVYTGLMELLSDPHNQHLIRTNFPKPGVVRRNTGYALDSLLDMQPFNPQGRPFNLCSLIAGSEGTLMFITEIKIGLIPLPPKNIALVCIHCATLQDAFLANITALRHKPMASELVDRYIMNFTLQHPEYYKNCFFIEGDPAAILMVEFMAGTLEEADLQATQLITELQQQNLGYAWPVLHNTDTRYAWDVRKAGLGLLRNLPGDTQPVNLIEDCAVDPLELPQYIAGVQEILARYGVNASYYAHAGAGEIHVEPMINLKSEEGVHVFRRILAETVELVKKFRGSLSGEHGDGRLRGEFIASVTGAETYALFERVKHLFDPHGVFNKGKVTGTPPMDEHLRVNPGQRSKLQETLYDFNLPGGMLAMAEKCSGSGDCRKTEVTGGIMCPSYMATRSEKDTTRARANLLRQFLSAPHDVDPLNHEELREVLDLCLSCKGCKTECPSAVDVAKMKAEFLYQFQQKNGYSFRTRLIGNFNAQMRLASAVAPLYNLVAGTPLFQRMMSKVIGFHPDRSMPKVHAQSLRKWYNRQPFERQGKRTVYFFCDEFSNYLDVEIGKKAILLLIRLGYNVIMPPHRESGRSFLSKGMLAEARKLAVENIQCFAPLVSDDTPLIGLEPSAILSFRDEYIDLVRGDLKTAAQQLARQVFTIDEFLANEIERGHISSDQFTTEKRSIVLHGHCYQKVLSAQQFTYSVLSLPENYSVQVIPSGCCGMAGSFGYEKEHYGVSQQVGELVLYPAIRRQEEDVLIVAAGTSCRHQIKDGTGRIALHPVEVMMDALKK